MTSRTLSDHGIHGLVALLGGYGYRGRALQCVCRFFVRKARNSGTYCDSECASADGLKID